MPRTPGAMGSGLQDEGRPSIPGVIATAITISGFSVLLSTQRQQLSLFEQVVYGSIIAVSGVAFFVWIWYRPIRRAFENRRRERIARKNYPQLVRFCERFHGFTEYNMSNNPQYVIGNIRSQPGFQSVFIVESHYANFLGSELQDGVRTLKPTLKAFVWVTDLLTTMIRFYSEVFVAKPIVQIRTISDSGLGKIVPTHRDDYNAARERFVGFVSEYEEFISKVNAEFGKVRRKVGDTWRDWELLRSYHIERPKEL